MKKTADVVCNATDHCSLCHSMQRKIAVGDAINGPRCKMNETVVADATSAQYIRLIIRLSMRRGAPESPLMSFDLRSRALMILIVMVLSVG